MLGRLRIRQKIGVLLAIPLTAVALVMAVLAVERVADARAYAATAETALAARDVGGLIQTLQQERLLVMGYLVLPSLERSAIVVQGQAVVAETARLAAQPRTANIIARARPFLDALERIRPLIVEREALPRGAYAAYRAAVNGLMGALNLANQRVADADGLRELLALDALMRSNEEASSVGAIVVGAATDGVFNWTLLSSVLTADQEHLRRFHELVPGQASLVDTVEAGEAAARLRRHLVSVDGGGPRTSAEVSEALTAALTYTGLRRLAQERLSRDVALHAQDHANTAAASAAGVVIGATLLFLAVVALAVALGRSISRPLRRLGRAVGAVAELSRAELVRVTDSEAMEVGRPELASVEVDTNDEIGDLATAVNRVQSTAAMLLERQASARANVAVMFANVSRRTQNLVGRQLQIIEELGRRERDPQTAERISHLEHLTTRLRRSADSLLVISGTVDQQLATMPARLADVFDAALVEIEGYRNVEIVQPVPDIAVPAELASDLRLLLAELLENATNFTPPGASVRLGATLDHTTSGNPYAPDCSIAVVDNGLGMSPARIAEENRRLVERERLDVAPTRVLGLFVVGRLARRHGLTVRLDPSPGRGVTALVRIPARLLSPGSVPGVPASLGVVPRMAAAALETASRSGPFPWLGGSSGQAAIGAAPVSGAPVSAAPVSAVPISAAPVTAAPAMYGGQPAAYRGAAPLPGARAASRDPEAERAQLNDLVSGFARATGDPVSEPDPRTTPAERHQ